MNFNTIDSDTLTISNGEWHQIRAMIDKDHELSCDKINVTLENGSTLAIRGEDITVSLLNEDR